MSGMLSLEHCARIATWNDTRRRRHQSRKTASRAKLACFIAFNVGIWTLFLAPVLFR